MATSCSSRLVPPRARLGGKPARHTCPVHLRPGWTCAYCPGSGEESPPDSGGDGEDGWQEVPVRCAETRPSLNDGGQEGLLSNHPRSARSFHVERTWAEATSPSRLLWYCCHQQMIMNVIPRHSREYMHTCPDLSRSVCDPVGRGAIGSQSDCLGRFRGNPVSNVSTLVTISY